MQRPAVDIKNTKSCNTFLEGLLNYVSPSELKRHTLVDNYLGADVYKPALYQYYDILCNVYEPLTYLEDICRRANLRVDICKKICASDSYCSRTPITFKAKDIYRVVSSIGSKPAYYILSLLAKDSSRLYEQLTNAVDAEDENSFIGILSNNDCDTQSISALCSWFEETDYDHTNGRCSECIDIPYEKWERLLEWGLKQIKYLIFQLWFIFDGEGYFSTLEERVFKKIVSHSSIASKISEWRREYEERVAASPTGLPEFSKRISQVQEDNSKEVTPRFSFVYDDTYISEDEFYRLPVLGGDTSSFYEYSKVFALCTDRGVFEITTLLYEFLCKEGAIEHTPENYAAFLFRMTARRRPEDEPVRIKFMKENTDLAYFIGRVINKVENVKGSVSNYESVDRKPRYENQVWEKTFYAFFDAGPSDKKRMSEAAKFKSNPRRGSFEQKCNTLVESLFDPIK